MANVTDLVQPELAYERVESQVDLSGSVKYFSQISIMILNVFPSNKYIIHSDCARVASEDLLHGWNTSLVELIPNSIHRNL